MPFTPDVYFALFEHYNLAIRPAQFVACGLGLLALALVFWGSRIASRIAGGVLALFWLWNGLVYHGIYFAQINFAAPVFAAFFVLQGLLLAWWLALRGDVILRFERDVAGWTGLVLTVFAMAAYPALGALAGHGWPQAAVFGVAPCPTVIYTLGLLLLARPRLPALLIVIPVFWALVGAGAVWLIGIPEDASLLLAAIVAVAVLFRKRRQSAQ